MRDYLLEIVQLSLGSSPEEMLRRSLQACIELSGATGGSILGEEGPFLQFLFSDVQELIGISVPLDSIAGVTVSHCKVVFTYAPSDKRHFTGVDAKLKRVTKFLLSIPIPSIHRSTGGAAVSKSAGALQLLFDENICPDLDASTFPREFDVETFRGNVLYETQLRNIFTILPIIAFGMEVMKLRQTSYQAIHELKNKLISGLSWLDYLREDIRAKDESILTNDAVKGDFEICESSIREGAELAKKYLQLTKLYDPVFAPTNLNALLSEIGASVRALGHELKAPSFQVKLDLSDTVPERNIDASQIKMALFNLCKNGVEVLVERGIPEPTIAIASRQDGARTVITVTDNGPGMPQEIAQNLFVPFKTKKEGGTGLGLTITKKIIDIHGGTIGCTTGASGTTFTLVI